MSYADLLRWSKKEVATLPELEYISPFQIGPANQFISFLHERWRHHPKSMAKNWKAHISVHPDDFERAWDIMLPILCQHAGAFKVVDSMLMKTEFLRLSSQLALLEEKSQSISNIVQSKDLSFHTLQELVTHYLSLFEAPYPKAGLFEKFHFYIYHALQTAYTCILNQVNPLEYLKNTYQKLYEKVSHTAQAVERFINGMQVTVFMYHGSENEHWDMLFKIEIALIAANIKPGSIHETDRALGKYVSVRHPGSPYKKAVDVSNYNPDNVKDPFSLLPTYYATSNCDVQNNRSGKKEFEILPKVDINSVSSPDAPNSMHPFN